MSLNLIRRLVKGTPLTATDHDGNLDKLETAMLARALAGAIGSSGITMGAGILGRESGSGAPQVYTLGSGLAIVGGALTATGGGGGGGGSGTVTSVAMTVPLGFAVAGSPITTTGTLGLTFLAGYSLPTTASQTSWDAAAGLASTAVQPAALTSALALKADLTDARFTDSREWSAATVSQAEAEAGVSTSRRAFTPQRVFQAAAAWWAGYASAVGHAVATAATQAAGRTALGLGSASTAATSDFATAAQGALAATAIQPSDSRLTDAREWSADTISQAEAEAGTATTRRAFTAQRVFQAVAAWWAASAAATKLAGIANGATANATDAQLRDRSTHTGTQSAATITGLSTVATSGAYGDLSGRPTIPAAADATPAALGTAAIGSSTDYAREDHVHALPSAADVGLGTASAPQFSRLGLGVAAATDLELAVGGAVVQLRQTVTAVSSTYTLDVTAANEFITSAAIAGAVTINLSNLASIPSGYVWRGVLRFQFTSGSVSWFAGNSGYTVKWDGGSQMTLTASDQEVVVIEVVGGGSVIEIAALRGRS